MIFYTVWRSSGGEEEVKGRQDHNCQLVLDSDHGDEFDGLDEFVRLKL